MKTDLKALIRVPVMGPDKIKMMTVSVHHIVMIGDVNIPSDLTGPNNQPIAKTVTGIFLPSAQPIPVDIPRDVVEKIVDDHLLILAGQMEVKDALTFEKYSSKGSRRRI